MNWRDGRPQPATKSRSLAPPPLGPRRVREKGRDLYEEGARWLISSSPEMTEQINVGRAGRPWPLGRSLVGSVDEAHVNYIVQ